MAGLSRDALIKRAALNVVPVQIGETDTVYIQELSGADRDQYEYFVQVTAKNGWRNVRAKLVQLSICDDDGNLLFKPDELDAIGALRATVLDPVFMAAIRLNGLEDNAIEQAEKKY